MKLLLKYFKVTAVLFQSIFDKLDGEEMRKARTRSNPFETIGKGIFLNRAAMKMANLDKVFDNMFTSPKTQDEVSLQLSLAQVFM